MPLDHQARVGRVLALAGLLREEEGLDRERDLLTKRVQERVLVPVYTARPVEEGVPQKGGHQQGSR